MPPDLLQLQFSFPHPQPGSGHQVTLADKLCDLLARRGRPLETGHVVAQVLRMRTCPERLQRRLVAEIVDGDPRLTWRGRDLVGLAPPGWAATTLDEATFCVLDIETTGGAPGRSKITEIAAVRMRGGAIIDRFEVLVDPGGPIPAPITRITGITDAMLVGQPRIEEALERFVAFVGDDVMVAHNAPFDFRFLNYERFRIAGRYFTQPWLDTLVIARRLLRQRLDRFDLGTLAEWAGTAVRPSHRALPDAEATAELLVRLLALLAERGHTTLERAVGFGQAGGARYAHKLALADALPQSPGVYIMRDRDGAPLYIGKARNIRRRVRSYFGPQGRHSRLVARALEAVARIDHEETGSELGALLRETALIRELRPPCNSRGVTAGGRRYIKLSIGDRHPRFFVAADVLDDGAAYYGPVRSERLTRAALDALQALYPIDMCHPRCAAGQVRLVDHVPEGCRGPCGAGGVDAHRAGVDQVRLLLESDQGTAMALLADRLAERSRDLPLLREPEGREALEALIAFLGALGRARSASRACGVIVEPGIDGRHVTALFVQHGRVAVRREMEPDSLAEVVATALAALGGDQHPAPLAPGELDAAMILHEWLDARAGHPGVVALRAGFDAASATADVIEAVHAMASFSIGPPAAGYASAA